MAPKRVLFLLLLAAALLTPASGSARPAQDTMRSNQPIRVTTVARGLKLSVAVPRRTYPRDALAQVTIELRNVSRHPIWAWTPGPPAPGVTFPQVQV